MEINSASESHATNTQPVASSSSSISPTLTILDELADRDRRSKNLILYNLSETCDPQTDKLKVQELFSTVFSLKEVQLNRITHLGERTDAKVRPLLVSFADALIRIKYYFVTVWQTA